MKNKIKKGFDLMKNIAYSQSIKLIHMYKKAFTHYTSWTEKPQIP